MIPRTAQHAHGRRILDAFLAAGAVEVAPDILLPADTLLDLYGEDIRARAYLTTDPIRGEVALRPDFTVPVVEMHMAQGAEPARYCYLGEVFRKQDHGDTRPAHPRDNEYLQAGFELFSRDPDADAEVFALFHGLALWWGDVLLLYAWSGVFVMLARSWSVRRLAIVGGLLFGLFAALQILGGLALQFAPAEVQTQVAAATGATPERLAAVRAEIAGNGPLSDFTAGIKLETDGQPRVTGTVQIKAEEREGAPGTAFRARLDGDIASLTAPGNQQFFAGTSQVRADGWRGQDGRLLIPELKITTGALDLAGSVATTAQGAPESAHLTLLLGRDAGATQLPVALPFGDQPMTVNSGNLRLDYDAAQGSGWVLTGKVGDIARPDISLSELRLDGRGRVVLTEQQALSEIRGWLAFGMDDLAPTDPGLADALGRTLNGGLNLAFTPGNALRLWGMNVNADAFGFTGDMQASGLKSGIVLSGNVTARHSDLSRLSRLAGRDLGGQADAAVDRTRCIGRARGAARHHEVAQQRSVQSQATVRGRGGQGRGCRSVHLEAEAIQDRSACPTRL